MLSGHPWFDLEVLAASGKSAGSIYRDAVNWKLLDKMPEEFGEKKIVEIDSQVLKDEGIDLVFSALPADVAREVEINLAKDGFKVFSNASAYRMHKTVPLLIADVNGEHIALVEEQKKSMPGYIVTNPNCSVTGLATALGPLNTNFGLKSCIVSTYQALSGAGYPGVPSLDIAGNVLPYIPNEEEKVEEECMKILGTLEGPNISPAPFYVIASCARVFVRNGHLESVVVELEQDVSVDEIKKVFGDHVGKGGELPTAPDRPLLVTEDESRPQPMYDVHAGTPERARGMAVTVGRIVKTHSKLPSLQKLKVICKSYKVIGLKKGAVNESNEIRWLNVQKSNDDAEGSRDYYPGRAGEDCCGISPVRADQRNKGVHQGHCKRQKGNRIICGKNPNAP
jgi:aspartate-semialdehyde dehydrogenase